VAAITPSFETLCGANHSGFVRQQHHEKSAEREAHGLHGDARVGVLEHGGDATERQAFKERIDRRGDR
jgi:hypothetical protein